MATNVRCAGKKYPGMGGQLGKQEWPCEPQWKGYRKPHPVHGVPTKTLPCPRCGGRVEPIP